jgi:glutamate-5-semialdehyde dehydrogenase
MSIEDTVREQCEAAKGAARVLATTSTTQRNAALQKAIGLMEERRGALKEANARDMKAGQEAGLSTAMLGRLRTDDKRIGGMIQGLSTVMGLPDPVGEVRRAWQLPNGLQINQVTVPIGVIGIVYESRPNVTIDAAALCLKAGNAAVLRGGSEAIHSNGCLAGMLQDACEQAGLPRSCIEFIATTDRAAVTALLQMDRYIDLIVPRGGEELVRRVSRESCIPSLKHARGLTHTFVDADADVEMAVRIVHNAKVSNPGVCNTLETLLVHRDIAPRALPPILARLREAGVEVHGCGRTKAIDSSVIDATDEDWDTEYLDLILSVKIVDSLDEALEHIARHGSGLADAIVTNDYANAQRFLEAVDSATVYVNASTRFTDGGQFGFGAEIGISTDKLHARGPVGLRELVSTKYVVRGEGQVRE